MLWPSPRGHRQRPMVSPFEGPAGTTLSLSWNGPACAPTASLTSAGVSREHACIFCAASAPLHTHMTSTATPTLHGLGMASSCESVLRRPDGGTQRPSCSALEGVSLDGTTAPGARHAVCLLSAILRTVPLIVTSRTGHIFAPPCTPRMHNAWPRPLTR